MKIIFKENYKFILFSILLIFILLLKFPYYIDAPGGIENMNDKIEIVGNSSSGSFNLAYVKEYDATIPTILVALFRKDWDILKKEEVLMENETSKTYQLRDKILMSESVTNAISVAYTTSNSKIEVLSNHLYITYVLDSNNTNLEVGDDIQFVNSSSVTNVNDLRNIIEKYNIGDKLKITVFNNGKKYNRYAHVSDRDGDKIIGVLVSNVKEYKTDPNININIKDSESGPSGGLIMTLAIYNSLIDEDITKGYKIVGTGTIDLDGNVGIIGGVKYKLKSAVKSQADIFFVPNGENYLEAIKLKKENNYNIEIVGISTFIDAVNYLNNL